MKKELAEQFQAIQQKAKGATLPVFIGIPIHNRTTVAWGGNWESFIDLAVQSKASILYVEKTLFDSEEVEGQIADLIGRLAPPMERNSATRQPALPASLRIAYEASSPDDDTVERVWRNLNKWQGYKGQAVAVRCVWFKEAIAHEWSSGVNWWDECRQIIYSTVMDVRTERERAKREATTRLHECAKQMAQHERFADAKNDAKRAFMATQLFPDENIESAAKIADLAILYHWWSVEPTQSLDKEEKVRQMYQRGEPIANIAAVLDISVAKVKKAVDGVARISSKSATYPVADADG